MGAKSSRSWWPGSGEHGAGFSHGPALKRTIPGLCSLAPAALLLCPAAGQAQTLDDDYWISAMAYLPRIDTNVRVASKTQDILSTDIDFESDLKLDNDKVLPSITVGARFGKIIVNADFYKLSRSGSAMLERDITFDGVTYPASVEVGSSFDSDIYRLTVGYAFIQKPDLELGAAIGLHATRFDLSISGEGRVGNAGAATEVRRRDLLAPLPTIGLFATYKIAPRVELNARLDYLSLKIDDYDGKLVNAQAGVNYRFMRNFAIGAVYRYVDYRVGVDKDSWEGRVKYRLHGPAIVLQASF